MKQIQFVGFFVISIGIALALSQIACENNSRVSKMDVQTNEVRDSSTTNQLWRIWLALHKALGDNDRYPKSLSILESTAVDPTIFVSPGTGSKPGVMNAVEDWADFIYVGGATEDVPLAAMVISPPENHQGKYGFALCVAGNIFRISAAEVPELISNPCLFATNTPQENIRHFNNNISVRIPKHLRPYYGTNDNGTSNK